MAFVRSSRRAQTAEIRPAVVLSPAAYNERSSLILVAPVTTTVKGYPFEVLLPEGLPIAGAVLSDQLKSVDWRERNAQFICTLPDEITAQILTRAALLLAR
ncbi:MAG: type II toxin-antitoxin system PemK/MazF family toxin [Thermoanaerobaculia bacterium]